MLNLTAQFVNQMSPKLIQDLESGLRIMSLNFVIFDTAVCANCMRP